MPHQHIITPKLHNMQSFPFQFICCDFAWEVKTRAASDRPVALPGQADVKRSRSSTRCGNRYKKNLSSFNTVAYLLRSGAYITGWFLFARNLIIFIWENILLRTTNISALHTYGYVDIDDERNKTTMNGAPWNDGDEGNSAESLFLASRDKARGWTLK